MTDKTDITCETKNWYYRCYNADFLMHRNSPSILLFYFLIQSLSNDRNYNDNTVIVCL
jgi:hypothetical protein